MWRRGNKFFVLYVTVSLVATVLACAFLVRETRNADGSATYEAEDTQAPPAMVVAERKYQPARSQPHTTWVTTGCRQYTSWGNCMLPERRPVTTYATVPEAYYVTVWSRLDNATKTFTVTAAEYERCSVDAPWPGCRG